MKRWTCSVLLAVSLFALTVSSHGQGTDAVTAAANARKAQADAEAAAYAAETAKYNAQTAAAKSKLGTLATVPEAGSVEVGSKSGQFEATLLSSDATRVVAKAIVDQIKLRHLSTNPQADPLTLPKIVIAAESESLSFDAYDAYMAQVQVLEGELSNAVDAQPFPNGRAVAEGSTSGGLLTAFAVVANLFRSDFKISSLDLTPSDKMLIKATIRAANEAGVRNQIFVPSFYAKPVDVSGAAFLKLANLNQIRNVAAVRLVDAKKGAATSKELDYSTVIAQLETAIKHFDDFAAKISTADAQGNVLLALVARQERVAEILRTGGKLLILKADASGGSAYAKKNFWTFFGELPFSVSAGTVASFALVAGRDGLILDSGVFGKTSPYMKVKKISRLYEDGFEASQLGPQQTSTQESL